MAVWSSLNAVLRRAQGVVRPLSRRPGRIGIVAVLGLALAACSPIYRNHGYAPPDEELALIEVGRDTRETVAASVGRPSASGLLNDVGWFYVQSRWKHPGGRAPQEIDRQVVAISFADDGVVSNVERFGLEDGRVVPLSRRVTESNIRGASLISQLLRNLGTLRAEDLIDE